MTDEVPVVPDEPADAAAPEEPLDPKTADAATHEVVDVSEEKSLPDPLSDPEAVAALKGKIMRASDLLPEVEPVEAPDDVVPPTPEEADLQSLPLAEREQRKLAAMTPEQRLRYGTAQAEIMSHPAVEAFAREEERSKAAKEATSAAFLAAYRKKQKEKT